MKLIRYRYSLPVWALIVIQTICLTSCNTNSYNSKHQVERTGFLGFYLDMDYLKVKSIMDSLLNSSELQYFETTDMVGNRQKNLYHGFSGISPSLFAKVNLRGTYIIDERLTSIQLTLCTRSDSVEQRFSSNCEMKDLKRLFEFYEEKYGKPALLGQGEKYNWLSKKISDVYSTGPKGRWLMDKIYFWDKGNYIIFFDFGFPESLNHPDIPVTKSDVHELNDSTSAPIIYYDFTQDYLDKLLEKASMIKEGKSK